jgi:hypothetical protein
MEKIPADEAYRKYAKPDKTQRKRFLYLAMEAFGMDAFAGIEYYDGPEDIEGEWREFFKDIIDEWIEEKESQTGLLTVPVRMDEDRKVVIPLKTWESAELTGKGHKCFCFVFAKEFEEWDYYTFMNALYDHEHHGHAVPYRDGYWLGDRESGRRIGYEGFAENAGIEPEEAFPLFFRFSEIFAHNHQLSNGSFIGNVPRKYRLLFEESFLRNYMKIFEFPHTDFRDEMVCSYFFMPWVYEGIAVPDYVDGTPYLFVKMDGEQQRVQIPERLARRIMP